MESDERGARRPIPSHTVPRRIVRLIPPPLSLSLSGARSSSWLAVVDTLDPCLTLPAQAFDAVRCVNPPPCPHPSSVADGGTYHRRSLRSPCACPHPPTGRGPSTPAAPWRRPQRRPTCATRMPPVRRIEKKYNIYIYTRLALRPLVHPPVHPRTGRSSIPTSIHPNHHTRQLTTSDPPPTPHTRQLPLPRPRLQPRRLGRRAAPAHIPAAAATPPPRHGPHTAAAAAAADAPALGSGARGSLVLLLLVNRSIIPCDRMKPFPSVSAIHDTAHLSPPPAAPTPTARSASSGAPS